MALTRRKPTPRPSSPPGKPAETAGESTSAPAPVLSGRCGCAPGPALASGPRWSTGASIPDDGIIWPEDAYDPEDNAEDANGR